MADDQAKRIGDRLRAEIARAASALTLEVTANLVEATPVDTGHARRNWVPAIGAAHQGEDGGAAQAAGIAAVSGYKLGDGPLSVSNNVPYIGRLIGGSSAQAPAGWDAQAVDEAVATIQAQYDSLQIDVSTGGTVTIAPKVPT